MCGRARCTLRADDVPRACHVNNTAIRHVDVDRYRPRYNVAPGSDLPVIRRDDGTEGCQYALHCMKWGLVPSFTKKDEKPDFYKMFNARSESAGEKASFRRLIPKNRCLVAVEGFYEWKKDGSKKQPYYIHFSDGRPLIFAALYDSWKNSEGEVLYTFTILTTSSSSTLQWLHDRMPVILGDEESTALWLNGSSSSKFQNLLKPYEKTDLAWYPVTPAMGKTSFDGPECIKEIPLKKEEKPISRFFAKMGADKVKEMSRPTEGSLDAPNKTPKEEPETQATATVASPVTKVEREQKPDGLARSPSVDTKSPAKRMHDELTTDSKPSSDNISQPYVNLPKKGYSPPKKKNITRAAAGDTQSTLFTYFDKS